MHAVSNFARKTGDFAALSLTDLKVIALLYDFENSENGLQYIRNAPIRLNTPASTASTGVTKAVAKVKTSTVVKEISKLMFFGLKLFFV